jgi:phosphoglycolate phosphatase-like HAD superfamily hydrolase
VASFSNPEPLQIQATSSTSQLAPRLWRWLAIAAAVLGACVLLYQGCFALLERQRERRRAQRRRSGPVGVTLAEPLPEPVSEGLGTVSRADERVPTAGVPAPASTDGDLPPPSRPPAAVWSAPAGVVNAGNRSGGLGGGGLRLLLIETAGVLFDVVDPVTDLLVPYVRARGSALSARQIDDWYVARVVGGLPAGDFWAGLGIVGDPMLLDDSYARRYELSPDIIEFLRSAGERGLEVAALGDEVSEWVGVFRQRHRLDEVVGAWISSGEVGVRPPHPALLRAVWRATGFAPEESLVVGRNVPLLDVAASQGARTVQYAPTDDPATSAHPVLRSFARVTT